jgi:hypothetical protein
MKAAGHARFIAVVEALTEELLSIAHTAPDEMTTFERYALERMLSLLGRDGEFERASLFGWGDLARPASDEER